MPHFARAASVLILALAFVSAGAARGESSREFRKTLPLGPGGRVEVQAYKGTIDVTAGTAPEVEVVARIEPDGDGPEQEENVRATRVVIERDGDSVRIESDYSAVNGRHGFLFGLLRTHSVTLPFVRYTIRMPAGTPLSIEDYKSEIRVKGLDADLKLDTYKGTVTVTELGGAAHLKTYKGDVHLGFSRFLKDSAFDTYKGRIEVQVPRDSRFEVDASTGRHGTFESGFAVASHARRGRDERTRGAVNGGGPTLRLSTYKGELDLRGN